MPAYAQSVPCARVRLRARMQACREQPCICLRRRPGPNDDERVHPPRRVLTRASAGVRVDKGRGCTGRRFGFVQVAVEVARLREREWGKAVAGLIDGGRATLGQAAVSVRFDGGAPMSKGISRVAVVAFVLMILLPLAIASAGPYSTTA